MTWAITTSAKNWVSALLLPILLAGFAHAGSAGTPLPRNTSRYDFSALSAQLQTYITNGTQTGFNMMIVKDGEIVYEQGFGNYSTTKVTSIASASKMPTALAVMNLVDSGALTLDDLVSKFIPNWPADKAEMTIAHLLSCTSGFPFDQSAVNDKTITLEQAVQQIAQMPLLFPPGTQFAYNPNGFHVAARIVEVVTGKSWNAHFQETLYNPLGMSTFAYSGANNPWVAGGGSCNSEDYIKILALHLDQGWWPSGRLYQPETIAVMQQDFIGSKPIFSSPATDGSHYGLSWWLSPPAPGQPVTEFSDPGAFGTTPWLDIPRNYGAILLINDTGVAARRIWNAARPLINATLDAANEPPSIRLQPVGSTVDPGQAVAFYALGAGRGPLTYQWQKDGITIPGATNSFLRLNSVSLSDAGGYRVVVSNSLASATSNAAPLVVTAPPVPVITSAPTATPNPATVSQTLAFFVAATHPIGVPLSYSWDFGDGATASGETATHAYTAAGTFVSSVTVSDSNGGSVIGFATVVVNTANGGGDGGGGGGGGGTPTIDTDGDGVSDAEEISAGTDPLDPTSAPMKPLVVTSLFGSAKFGVDGKDALRVSGVVNGLPAEFKTEGITALLNAGGATSTFTLNAKGSAKSAFGTFSIKLKQTRNKATKTLSFLGGDAPFKAKLSKGTWSDDWADEGLSGTADLKNAALQMLFKLTLGGQLYGVTVDSTLNEKAAKTATFKKTK